MPMNREHVLHQATENIHCGSQAVEMQSNQDRRVFFHSWLCQLLAMIYYVVSIMLADLDMEIRAIAWKCRSQVLESAPSESQGIID
jgi:hypothetical protein